MSEKSELERERTGQSQFNVLALDGGGSKGIYTLGVLKEFEAHINKPLHQYFDLIYGTSTGSIIASLLALGKSVSEIEKIYLKIIPKVMTHKSRLQRSRELRIQANDIFKDAKFDAFLTRIGIVATNHDLERPLIFKSTPAQAFGLKPTFAAGFDCTIADAVIASCAAFPFFEMTKIQTSNQGDFVAMDGGFSANNPTLFAIADAAYSIGISKENIKILSIGVGHYNEPQRNWYSEVVFKLWPFKMIQKLFATNTNTVETLRKLLFKDITCIRVDESFPDKKYETDLLEANIEKLKQMQSLGRNSYANQEQIIHVTFPREMESISGD